MEVFCYGQQGNGRVASGESGDAAIYELGTGSDRSSNGAAKGAPRIMRSGESCLACTCPIRSLPVVGSGEQAQWDQIHSGSIRSLFKKCFAADANGSGGRTQDGR